MTRQLTRRQQKRQETIEEILTIAREEMRTHGVAALSLGKIARRMGIKTPSLYNYFPNKDAIYDELFKRGFILYGKISRKQMATLDMASTREIFLTGLSSYMNFALAYPEYYQIMFQRPVPGFEPSAASYQIALDLLSDFYGYMQQVIEINNLAINLSTSEAVDLLIAMMHGLTEMHLANNPELPVGEGRYGHLIPAAVDVFLSAWVKKPT